MSVLKKGVLLPLLAMGLASGCSSRTADVDDVRLDSSGAHSDSPSPASSPAPSRDTAAADDDQPQYQPGRDPWAASRARGASFRGIGQEPGWTVEVFPGRSLVALLDYGERTITAPWSAPRSEDGAVTFTSTTAAGDLVLTVTPVACADAMSGERMSHTVVLRYGSDEYRGCGRVLGDRWPAP